jgi:hypothetical protein
LPVFGLGFLPAAKSIYPPLAESNGYSGILPPPFGRTKNAQAFWFGIHAFEITAKAVGYRR